MSMHIAFYRGAQVGFQGIVNRLVRWWTRGPYSHCELVFSDGMCGSASLMDGGVRLKRIDVATQDWVLVPIGGNERAAREWFCRHAGEPYDLAGDFSFVWGACRDDSNAWFCSEAIAEALLVEESWRFNPNTLAAIAASLLSSRAATS